MNTEPSLLASLVPDPSVKRARLKLILLAISLGVAVLIYKGMDGRWPDLGFGPENHGDGELDEVLGTIPVLKTNLVRYRTMTGSFPSEAEGLEALTKIPSTSLPAEKPRILMDVKNLLDPWGHPYQYRNPGKKDHTFCDVYSLGPDGLDGTGDDVYP